MQQDNSFFDLNGGQLEEIQNKYALLEPLVDTYLSESEKREYSRQLCSKLGISERTLRRYLQRFREEGIYTLTRKKRSDAGVLRVFSDEILKKALQLLEQNSSRSIPMLMKLLETDEQIASQVRNISPSTLYYHLKEAGYNFKNRDKEKPQRMYRRFQAEYPNQLWQGDARHGIPLPNPDNLKKNKMTYLFAWMDDFSRKIMYAKYYWDEKLPRMEDCFRHAVLRWGLPEKIYCDNGRVYVSNHFLLLVTDLEIKKIHHPAYAAWCKGKIESVMKLLKKFQSEAVLADFKTIEELNSTMTAWLDVEYDNKIHSSTGEPPNNRWRNNLNAHPPRRIKDIDKFNSLFFWRTKKNINKYGKIQFNKNGYPIHTLPVGEKVELRYDPFDLSEVQVFKDNTFYCKLRASSLVRKTVPGIPEEKKKPTISKETVDYFKNIREKASEFKRKEAESIRYSDLLKEEE
jgi:transposase